MAYVSKKQVSIIIFSDEIGGDFKKRDLFMLCNEMHQHLEDLQNLSESVYGETTSVGICGMTSHKNM